MYFSAFKGNAPPVEVRVYYALHYVEMSVEPELRVGDKDRAGCELAFAVCCHLLLRPSEHLSRTVSPFPNCAKEMYILSEFTGTSDKKHYRTSIALRLQRQLKT